MLGAFGNFFVILIPDLVFDLALLKSYFLQIPWSDLDLEESVPQSLPMTRSTTASRA